MKQIKSKGFTLIEVMITVAIIGILAAIAMPQYSDYLLKTGRGDATKALAKLVDKQEGYVTRNNATSYDPGMTMATEFGYYTVITVNAGPGYFQLEATAVPGMAQELDIIDGVDCTVLTIDSAGVKTPPECWVK